MTRRSRIRRHPLLLAAFGLALALTLFFAVRLVFFTLVWSDPAMRNQPIKPWMTPGFVAHSWQVPRSVIAEALDGAPERGMTLAEIARMRGVPEAELVTRIEAAIAMHRAQRP